LKKQRITNGSELISSPIMEKLNEQKHEQQEFASATSA